jgi:soluble lytic murein transglycosylase-like protein
MTVMAARRMNKRNGARSILMMALATLVLGHIPHSQKTEQIPAERITFSDISSLFDEPITGQAGQPPELDFKAYKPIPTVAATQELEPYQDLFIKYALENGFNPDLIARQAWKESRGDSLAVSNKGAYGVMQVQIPTGRDAGLKGTDQEVMAQLFDPETNIRIGCEYLRKCKNKFGRIDQALAAYNAGPGNIAPALIRSSGPAHITKRWGKNQYRYDRDIDWGKVPNESRRYARDILGNDAPADIY